MENPEVQFTDSAAKSAAPINPETEAAKIASLKIEVEKAVEDARHTKQLTFFGFIIALVTLGGLIIATVAFVVTQLNQSNQQTLILQQIKDRVDLYEKKPN